MVHLGERPRKSPSPLWLEDSENRQYLPRVSPSRENAMTTSLREEAQLQADAWQWPVKIIQENETGRYFHQGFTVVDTIQPRKEHDPTQSTLTVSRQKAKDSTRADSRGSREGRLDKGATRDLDQ